MDLSIASGAPPAPQAGPARRTTPGMVRGLVPHLAWEGLLVLLVVAAGIALEVKQSEVFTRGGLWAQLAVTGMFAAALALSLRTATPNLAVATLGTLSGWLYVHQVNDGTASIVAWLVAVVAALGIGLVLGLLVGLTPLPSWAVSLVATAIISGIIRLGDNLQTEVLRVPQSGIGDGVFITWMVVFAVGSVAAAVLFAVPRSGPPPAETGSSPAPTHRGCPASSSAPSSGWAAHRPSPESPASSTRSACKRPSRSTSTSSSCWRRYCSAG